MSPLVPGAPRHHRATMFQFTIDMRGTMRVIAQGVVQRVQATVKDRRTVALVLAYATRAALDGLDEKGRAEMRAEIKAELGL